MRQVKVANGEVGGQERLQRDRRRDLVRTDDLRRDLIDLLVNRLEEMGRLEEIRDAVERLVVDEDCAQKRLLRFDIVRCLAIGLGQLRLDGTGRKVHRHSRRSSKTDLVTNLWPSGESDRDAPRPPEPQPCHSRGTLFDPFGRRNQSGRHSSRNSQGGITRNRGVVVTGPHRGREGEVLLFLGTAGESRRVFAPLKRAGANEGAH